MAEHLCVCLWVCVMCVPGPCVLIIRVRTIHTENKVSGWLALAGLARRIMLVLLLLLLLLLQQKRRELLVFDLCVSAWAD